MEKKDSFKPPQAVRNAARRGLELRRRFNRGGFSAAQASESGVGSGVQRATNLSNGDAVSLDTVKRMRNFFSRHEQNYKPDKRENDGGPTRGTIAWLLWGGTPGRRWADKVLREAGELDKAEDKNLECLVAKVDSELGIVFGYAIVCKQDGEDYFDTQGDNIPEETMLEATAAFMEGRRMAKVMHEGQNAGKVVFGFPITTEIAKALGMTVKNTGFIVGMKPNDKSVLEKFKTGEFTGFSIGGQRVSETVVEE